MLMDKEVKSREYILLLSGGFKRESETWRSTLFDEKGDCGPTGSIARVIAARVLYEENRERILIASGGRGECETMLPQGLYLSSILRRELIEMGVPESSIFEDTTSHNTYEQLTEMRSFLETHGDAPVLIVSNAFHIPRIQAMLEYRPELAHLAKLSYTVVAEPLILEQKPEWQSTIETAYASEPLMTIIRKEKEGVVSIKAGTYRFPELTQ